MQWRLARNMRQFDRALVDRALVDKALAFCKDALTLGSK